MIWPTKTSKYQELNEALFKDKGVRVFMLRDDLLHPGISGNKWRKLKYNLLEIGLREPQAATSSSQSINRARYAATLELQSPPANSSTRVSEVANSSLRHSKATIVTVGGSHSNHIAAVAEAGKVFGFRTIGLIRGYEAYRNNPTLRQAAEAGMEIRFFDKVAFSNIEKEFLPKLQQEIGDFDFVPMGGGNLLGMKGCVEINDNLPSSTTHITTACGTGSTLAGIIAGAKPNQKLLGFPAMKNGAFMNEDVIQYLKDYGQENYAPFEIITDYHFGGFGKMNPELIQFINAFYAKHGFALDGIYNGKMMFGLYAMIREDYFPKGSVITAIHTGGVQGNLGLMEKYKCELPV